MSSQLAKAASADCCKVCSDLQRSQRRRRRQFGGVTLNSQSVPNTASLLRSKSLGTCTYVPTTRRAAVGAATISAATSAAAAAAAAATAAAATAVTAAAAAVITAAAAAAVAATAAAASRSSRGNPTLED